MDSAKEQRERFLLDRFLEVQGISPTSVERPHPLDFLIDLEGRKVGIELSELFIRSRPKGHPKPGGKPFLQDVESITNKIVSTARKIYFDAGNPLVMSTIWFDVESITNQIVPTARGIHLDACNSPVLSTVWFSSRITSGKMNGDQIAKLIADRIHAMSRQDSQAVAWRSSEAENEERCLSEWVDIIHTNRVPEYPFAQWKDRFAQWTVARPSLVAPLTPKHLQEVVDKKAKKINSYKKCACTEEIWLLIVADGTLPSRRFYVAPDFPIDSLSSPFAKTFYYSYPAEGVIDIANKANGQK